MNIIFARLVNTFNSLATENRSPEELSTKVTSTVNQFVLYIVYLFIGRLILAYCAILGFRITSLRISAAIRLHYLTRIFSQPISTLDALPPGQITSITTITANILQLGISERLSSLIQALTVITTALTIGCVFSWELTLVTSTGLVAIGTWYTFITPRVVKKQGEMREVELEAAGVVGEALGAIRMVKACGAEEKMGKMFDACVERWLQLGKGMSGWLSIMHAPVFFTIFAVLMSVMTMLAHINAVSVPLSAASNAINAASIFFTVIDAPIPDTGGAKGSEVFLSADIVLHRINFAYPARPEIRILNDLTLAIPRGRKTAIVGPSGSGKSTIVALIQRWYDLGGKDPVTNYLRNGEIRIGEKPLNQIDMRWWRSQIGFVQQETFLFNDTIFKNVAYGLTGTEWEDVPGEEKRKLVKQACKEAYADEFIEMLPEGYDTPVGDVGIQLSGGQRQRICIARAIVRRPKILIFDEATSALDVASERIVQLALEKVSHNRTTIVIAHRLSTIRNADNIIVMSQGKVVQMGTHESLLGEKGGEYANLVHAQQLHSTNYKHSLEDGEDELDLNMEDYKLIDKSSYGTLDASETTAVETESPIPVKGPRSIFRSIGILLYEQKLNSMGLLLILVGAMGAASSNPIQAYLFARLISSFAYWGDWLRATNTFLCLMLLAVATGVGLSYFTLGWVSNTLSIRTVSSYRKEYFNNTVAKPISFFDEPSNSIGILTANIASDPAQLQQLLGINMAMVLISFFGLIGCIAIAMSFYWRFALVIIGSSMPIILAGGWYRVRHEVKFESRNNEVFAESARFATEAIGAIRTVACLTLEQSICKRYDDLLKKHIDKSLKEARVSGIVFAASDSLVLLCMAFALWYGGRLLSRLEISSFEFLVVYLAVIQGTLAAGQWLSFGPNLAQVSLAATRIQSMRPSSFEDAPLTQSSGSLSSNYTLPMTIIYPGAAIEFRNISFTYPSRKNVHVLQNLNLRIQNGQFAAIVGSSGSGKSTIISLLERFYKAQRGQILYNQEDITKTPLHTFRKRLSLVAQEPYLFRGSIRDNVLLGMEIASRSEKDMNEAMYRACAAAGIHDFITSLPQGYATPIGNAGIALSGGQKQRISIARALIREPEVLLLDEATSALDAQTEKEVMGMLEETRKSRTMVVVAHRLATIRRADVIFVMNRGRIAEAGRHEELVAKTGGIYSEMVRAQGLL
ncbi:unnamed protein product [Periconia digitata]|uniref:Uncharacterized protein n=1 Tax=Periconia digitata TaxID=1303443 RepID=A0A9W4XPS1_9PLEO|nr:unnamed protein product [Periconia digitata]